MNKQPIDRTIVNENAYIYGEETRNERRASTNGLKRENKKLRKENIALRKLLALVGDPRKS